MYIHTILVSKSTEEQNREYVQNYHNNKERERGKEEEGRKKKWRKRQKEGGRRVGAKERMITRKQTEIVEAN